MTALLAAPWYFLAAFCLFGGVLIGAALWWLLVSVADGWPVDIDDPHDYFAEETRDPTKETQA